MLNWVHQCFVLVANFYVDVDNNLTTEKIKQSTSKADIANYYRKNTNTEIEDIIKDISKEDAEATEEDMELIEDFLNA